MPSESRPDTAVDPRRWPDVARVPQPSRVRTAVAAHLVRRALERLPLEVRTSGGETLGLGGPLIRLHDPGAFFRRVGQAGLIGFGESYMAGEWDAPDLAGVLTVLAGNVTALVPGPLQRLRALWAARQPASGHNTEDHSRRNIHHHYDLSNDLFAAFLDDTLTYSSALFRDFPAAWPDLADAQRRKTDRLLDLARVGPGTRLLEIGTGWGDLALRAAARGAHVVTATLSQEQLDLARQRVRAAGHEERVTLLLRDYRQLTGSYDAVVSVEMIEAVGADFWSEYFGRIDRLLAPGGRAALQAITMPHERMLATRNTYTWIQKYIFPGGLLPSPEAVEHATRDATTLRVTRQDGFGPHYAETLRLWRERFAERAPAVRALGFDATFQRMWTFYLAYSEAGFRSGYLDVKQLLLTRTADGATAHQEETR
ncbi:cyclopropane-fatty-acyl-phospholipid synthase [Streptomyces abyssalis]|uniref:Cyclopropane-fatty-acyl-phospholipid synthase n=1 Tax=Streptomyces abyssalis TaxID=933944 RepID=A0A1E7JTI5_9ACTN|nr:cyclopropane-fatty-acyl-phospholipid synthase family protein [Streptomyces abyssalis]OEU92219.1 cyclopropane-fatty-acyl-phospholipid synthase [Streptomyces abyssalis]OEU94338.1 cyclopropane-fatty-acyl-phospholipid synthase [Streptomyces abyssalis]